MCSKNYSYTQRKKKREKRTSAQSASFTSQWSGGSLHPGYRGPLPNLINQCFKYDSVPHRNRPVVTACKGRFLFMFLQQHLSQHWLLGFKQKVCSSFHPHYPGTEQDGGNPVAYALHCWDHTEFMLYNQKNNFQHMKETTLSINYWITITCRLLSYKCGQWILVKCKFVSKIIDESKQWTKRGGKVAYCALCKNEVCRFLRQLSVCVRTYTQIYERYIDVIKANVFVITFLITQTLLYYISERSPLCRHIALFNLYSIFFHNTYRMYNRL